MFVPAWHIGLMALAYAGEYFWRFVKRNDKKFISLGKALGRLLLAGTYLYIELAGPSEAQKIFLVRWSLFLYLGIDLFYIAQEHIMNRFMPHDN